ncbi:Arylsulfatase B [Halotydeus destructor]|nr:Arylsulfatase B [Halotydeus destructor]
MGASRWKTEIWLILLLYHMCILTASKQPPNIIMFIADDLGWDDVGYHGSPQIKTPNIDALAADGIVLDNFYAMSSCTPSRGALLSGVHPIHSSTQNYVILTAEPRGYPLDIKLLPEYLQELNYSSHAVGKWHLGFYKKRYTPIYRGFDSHVGFWTGSGDYYDHTALEDKTSWGLDFRHNLDCIRNASGTYSTDYFTDRAMRVIDEHDKEKPLFLYMAYQAVHDANHYSKLQAPKHLVDQFPNISNKDRRTFAGMLLSMDLSIGKIFAHLSEKNMLENSIVIFMSDNGGPASGFQGNVASNWPLRGTKCSLWEGGVHVPAVLWSPLLNKSSYTSDNLMYVTDWLPTLLTAVGSPVPPKSTPTRPVDGKSLWAALSAGQPSPRKRMLLNIDPVWNTSAIRVGDYKLVQGLVYPKWSGWLPPLGHGSDTSPVNYDLRAESLVYQTLTKMHRLVNWHPNARSSRLDCGAKPVNASSNCHPDVSHCLYNIKQDPCEYNNLAKDKPGLVAHLWAMILKLNATASPVGREPLDSKSWPPAHSYTWSTWADVSD